MNIENLKSITLQIAAQERAAREEILKSGVTEDKIFRAYGILNYCRILSYKEAVELSGNLRLGVNLGFLESISLEDVNNFLLNMGQAYLSKKLLNTADASVDCDVQRATLAREIFVK